jgi:flotillin
VKIEVSKADKEANDARVDADTAIAIKNNDLALKRAALKQQADTAQADADAAYAIQQQEQQKTINIKTVEAQIEKTKREQILSKEQIEIAQNQLVAEIEKRADADKYKVQTDAAADLEQRKRVAEAQKYEAEQRALAENAASDAARYRLEQEAMGIKAKGEAEAYAIQKKGEAEALAMDKKAEAYKKYNNAAIAQMMIEILPQIVENVAKPISAIKDVNIYSADGKGISAMSGNVPVAIKQAFDVLKSATGVDMADIMRAGSIEAVTTRNVNLNEEAAEMLSNVAKNHEKKGK